MYSGAAAAQTRPPTIMAVANEASLATAVSTSAPIAAAGWKTIEFRDNTVVRCRESTSR